MPHLRPCSGCNRHVRSDEVRCPFCDDALPVDERPPPIPAGRMGRAALMAFGAAIATASLAGCDGKKDGDLAIGAEESAPTARPDTETRTAPAEQERRKPQGSAVRDDAEPMKSPFLVGAEPPPTPPSNAAARPAETAVAVPPVNTIKKPPPPPPPPPDVTTRNHWNHAKPYGAPPADGLLDEV
ncbi:MAG: hypothetical protein HUU21_07000 [Polyangiaceae bacterium]|nr:hypothetical protein [Polyangiaceae bacterium]